MSTINDPSPAPGSPAALEAMRAASRARTEELRRQFDHELDLAYGDHRRQRLDVYRPAGAPAGPVLVFLHGGGFRGGDHGAVGYHGRPYLEAGAVFVSMSYRVLPDVRFPDMCADVEAALNWLQDYLPGIGADASHLYVSGHSAGATLGAMAGLRPIHQKAPEAVRGLALISGGYEYTRRPPEEQDTSSPYYVERLGDAIERVPEHTIVVWSDDDLPFCEPDGAGLVAALAARGASVEQFLEQGVDHYEANRSFVDPSGVVAGAVKAMMGLGQ